MSAERTTPEPERYEKPCVPTLPRELREAIVQYLVGAVLADLQDTAGDTVEFREEPCAASRPRETAVVHKPARRPET